MRAIMILMLVLTGCNLPTESDETPEEEIIGDNTQVDVPTPTGSPTPTLTAEPTRTLMPTPEAIVPTSRNAPTNMPQMTSQPGDTAAGDNPGAAASQPQIEPVGPAEQAVGLSTADGMVRGSGVNLLDVPAYHYAQNPANPDRFSVVDEPGMLYITDRGGANAFRIEQGPFTQFPAPSREDNNAATILSKWSPDGRYVAFIVAAGQQASDGVWYFQPGTFAPLQLVVDCPQEGVRSCMIVTAPDETRFWRSRNLYWSPDGNTLLINAELPQRGRRGLMVIGVTRNERVRDQRPPMLDYEYGTWGNDGRILASGANPEGTPTVAWLNPDGSLSEVIYPVGANGLWMGWANQAANGSIYALGRSAAQGPLALYDMNGDRLTEPIGSDFPSRVVWSPDGRFVYVEAGSRRYVAGVNGLVSDVTAATAGKPVNWVR